MREAIRGTRGVSLKIMSPSSSVIKRHQASSSVIKRHQASSSVIKRHQAEGLTQAAKRLKTEHDDGDQLCPGRRSSRRLQLHERGMWIVPDEGGHPWSSVVISGHQLPSVAISGHQLPSVVLRGHLRTDRTASPEDLHAPLEQTRCR